MVLTAKIKITEIKKKTKAVLFKDIQVGDELTLNYNISGCYGYAPTISINHAGKWHDNNVTQLSNNISNFEYEQIA